MCVGSQPAKSLGGGPGQGLWPCKCSTGLSAKAVYECPSTIPNSVPTASVMAKPIPNVASVGCDVIFRVDHQFLSQYRCVSCDQLLEESEKTTRICIFCQYDVVRGSK